MEQEDAAKRNPERFLVGPTGIGKSAVAEELALRRSLTLLSMDSMQIFRGMDVGTAKPSAEDRSRVRYELLDLVDPRGAFSVAAWVRAAEDASARARAAGSEPLYVGGTALYLKALTHGLFDGPAADEGIRARWMERIAVEGARQVHGELLRRDPAAAAKIHPHDTKRLVRALEVHEITGRPISALQQEWKNEAGTHLCIVGLRMSREALAERMARRVQQMFAAGWIDEVARIEAEGGLGTQAMGAVGYAAIAAYLRGERSRAGLEEEITTATRQFARRQMTWYRSFPQIHWIDVESSGDVAALASAAELHFAFEGSSQGRASSS